MTFIDNVSGVQTQSVAVLQSHAWMLEMECIFKSFIFCLNIGLKINRGALFYFQYTTFGWYNMNFHVRLYVLVLPLRLCHRILTLSRINNKHTCITQRRLCAMNQDRLDEMKVVDKKLKYLPLLHFLLEKIIR